MFEITRENALEYLRERGVVPGGFAEVEELSGGVSNLVLRITTPQRRFVLKQSRPQLRTRDPWFSDLARIYREWEVMQALQPHLPTYVPEVLFVDRPNYAYAMSHAPLDATVWKAELLNGNIDLELGKKVGLVLGRIHEVSASHLERFEAFRDHNVYVQLRVDPFYRRVQERRPEVAQAIAPIIEQMLTLKQALCHGDYTPKNMLVHHGAFTLVDYETAHLGDPTMDLGLFLAHLTLKAVRSPERTNDFIHLMRAFWQGYETSVTAPMWRVLWKPHVESEERSKELGKALKTLPPLPELQARGVRHLGVCLLARVDGTSPVDYLSDEPKRERVRRLGRMILLDEIKEWEFVWHWLARDL
jgi:5-methylthioribose kinase